MKNYIKVLTYLILESEDQERQRELFKIKVAP